MTWVEFVKRWPLDDLVNEKGLKIPKRTVYAWLSGEKEPKLYHRDALEFWIEGKLGAKAGEKVDETKKP